MRKSKHLSTVCYVKHWTAHQSNSIAFMLEFSISSLFCRNYKWKIHNAPDFANDDYRQKNNEPCCLITGQFPWWFESWKVSFALERMNALLKLLFNPQLHSKQDEFPPDFFFVLAKRLCQIHSNSAIEQNSLKELQQLMTFRLWDQLPAIDSIETGPREMTWTVLTT